MPNLANFTINSNFPAIKKSGVVSAEFNIPAVIVNNSEQKIRNSITVLDGDIIFPIIEINGVKYPTGAYSDEQDNGNSIYYIITERISPTQVDVVCGFSSSIQKTFPAFNLKIHLNSFQIP